MTLNLNSPKKLFCSRAIDENFSKYDLYNYNRDLIEKNEKINSKCIAASWSSDPLMLYSV